MASGKNKKNGALGSARAKGRSVRTEKSNVRLAQIQDPAARYLLEMLVDYVAKLTAKPEGGTLANLGARLH
jgi:hypothetical protein